MSRQNSEKIVGILSMGPRKFASMLFNIALILLISIPFIYFIGIPGFSAIFQSLSPWNEQKKVLSEYTDVRDAYSAIIGSEVGVVPQNGIIKWFSVKDKEIIINIPKLINYSPLFDDESRRNELKNAFVMSLDEDQVKNVIDQIKIFYDGAHIVTITRGEITKKYQDLSEFNKKQLNEFIKNELNKYNIKFKKWETNNKFTFDPVQKDVVVVDEVFLVRKHIFFSERYKLKAKLKMNDLNWIVYKNNWKVEKIEK